MALEEKAASDIMPALSGVSSALALCAVASEVDEGEGEGVFLGRNCPCLTSSQLTW